MENSRKELLCQMVVHVSSEAHGLNRRNIEYDKFHQVRETRRKRLSLGWNERLTGQGQYAGMPKNESLSFVRS